MIPLEFQYVSFRAPKERGGKPFSYANYLCLYSAIKSHPGAIFNFYYDEPISGEWFQRLIPYLKLHQLDPPQEIFGQPLKRVEHQADITRLQVLQEKGGIYLDTDVFVCRTFKPLLNHQFVMGIEERQGLCNGVILSEPQSPFVNEWLLAYHPESKREGAGFDPDGWAEMSVRFPEILARSFSDYVTVLPSFAFHEPMGCYTGLKSLFEDPEYANNKSYAQHLWASRAWDQYLNPMTPEKVMQESGYFYRLARTVLDENEIFGLLNQGKNLIEYD